MKKDELKNKVKVLAKQVYKTKIRNVNLDKGGKISLDSDKFPVLAKFPKLKKIIIDLLTNQYDVFMTNIEWVAPRPTTFRIILGNGENFLLIYTERSWIAQVEGKKYYLLNLGEEEQAAESISRLLAYGKKSETTDTEENPETTTSTKETGKKEVTPPEELS